MTEKEKLYVEKLEEMVALQDKQIEMQERVVKVYSESDVRNRIKIATLEETIVRLIEGRFAEEQKQQLLAGLKKC